ncbi:MAG: Jag N-terminal domain-containing protein, partial [Coriobacteriia bacterium]|nr:Jag N-terminal domain-containing protein [Coriobacteriia bacterium]
MSKEYIATADTIEDAKAEALAELGIDESDATIEILEEPGKKLFGSRKSAVVKVSTSTAKNAPDDDSQGSETNAKTDTEDAAD